MKKTEYISFRTTQETKEALEKIAAEKKWSISFPVKEIVEEYLKQAEKQEQ